MDPAVRKRMYREKLKSDPQKLKAFLEKERLRDKARRQKRNEVIFHNERKLEEKRQSNRMRQHRSRENKKTEMETLSPLKSYLGLMRKVPDHEKIQLSKKSKTAFKNRSTPTRYERERAAMKNKPRKVLNLEERVLAIRLYHENPVYQRVASAFKCSWEQIRNVIANRDDILRYYGECQTVTSKDSPQYARNKKINFLGNVTYEFVKRAYYHQSAVLNDEVVQQRATKIRDILKISQFHPNKAWISDFKKVYNIDWNNLEALIIIGIPPQSLDIKDLIEYCTRMVSKSFALIGEVPKQIAKKETKNDDFENDNDDDDGDAYGSVGDFGDVYGGDNASDSMLVDNYDDVPVVNEIDDFVECGRNDDEIEMNEDEAETITPHNYDDTVVGRAPNASSVALQQDTLITKSSTQLLADVHIKEEQRSRSNSPTLNVECSTSAHGVNVKVKRTEEMLVNPAALEQISNLSDSINTYADAMRALSPLEDFAIQQEDFRVMNLLTQLAHIFEKGAKRKSARRNI